jgi:hypothetical protein
MMNENHKRALGTSLRVIERHLNTISEELEKNDRNSNVILNSIMHDVDPHTKKKILTVTASMLEEIRQLKEIFKLEKHEASLRRLVYSTIIEIWIILEDLRPEKLAKAYGRISDTDKKLLEPHILKLLKMLNEIR